jgi:hypothetical protein
MRYARQLLRAKSTHLVLFTVCVALIVAIVIALLPGFKARNELSADSMDALAQPQFGIAAGSSLEYMNTNSVDAYLQSIKDLGVDWVRFDVDWSVVQESGPNSFNWAPFDAIVAGLNKYGLKGLGILDYTPVWARSNECVNTNKCSPADPADFGTFAAAAAARYAPLGLHDWEIWNEPNTTNFWQPDSNPTQYVAILKAAYTSIKVVDPTATVITGGLAPASSVNGNLSMIDFLKAIYEQHAEGYFDAVAVHPYSFPFLPSSSRTTNPWNQLESLHQVMASNNDGRKQIWITEYGAPTNGHYGVGSNGVTVPKGRIDHITSSLQAQMVTDAVSLYKTYSWMGPFFWYSYQDTSTVTTTDQNFFGLVDAHGNKKLAYYAYQQAIQNSK